MHKICFYVPENYADVVKNAMFAAGAGKVGKYTCSSWQSLGEGQFLAQQDGKPVLTMDNLEKMAELKVEMICEDHVLTDVIQALKTSHPYEQPSYQAWQLSTL
jgi:structural toxin protein (hemagglutinin/hemolysin) RtxA